MTALPANYLTQIRANFDPYQGKWSCVLRDRDIGRVAKRQGKYIALTRRWNLALTSYRPG